MNPVEEVARLRQKVLYSNSTLQLPSNSSDGGVQVCHSKACLLQLSALYCLRGADKLVCVRRMYEGSRSEASVPTAIFLND